MQPHDVVKQFKEPGHIPQKLKHKMYHPIDEVIPYDKWQSYKKQKKHKKKIPDMKAAPRPSSLELWDYDSPIRLQFGSTCTSHGLIAGIENLATQADPKQPMLSARYLWSQYQEYSVYSAIEAATKNKQVEDKYWPQNSSKPVSKNLKALANVSLLETTFLDDDTDAVLDALAEKKPVYVGMAVPSDMAACRSTIRPTTRITDGGHALAVVGYHLDPIVSGGGYLILKNSWGTDCGDEGYQYFPIGLCKNEDMYCVFWSIDSVKKG